MRRDLDKYHSETELLSRMDGRKKSLTDQLIKLYIRGDVSDDVMTEFLTWLASDVHAEEKNEVLTTLWESIDRRATRSTFRSLSKVKAKISHTAAATVRRMRLSPGAIMIRVAAVLIPVMAIAGAFLWFGRGVVETMPVQVANIIVEVPRGQNLRFMMNDGTEVWAKGGSRLEYPEQFSDIRNVKLEGEAFFSVAKADAPFILDTDHSRVRVLGTRFNVSDYPGDDDMTVTLERGSIEATVGGASYIMEPGDEIYYNHLTAQVLMSKAPRSYDMTKNVVVIEKRTLSEIFTVLERRYGYNIEVSGNVINDERYTTRFDGNATIDEIMTVLQGLTGQFRYTKTGDTIKVVVSR